MGPLTGLVRVWKTEDYFFVLGLVSLFVILSSICSYHGLIESLLTVKQAPFLASIVLAIIGNHYGVGMQG